MASLLGSKEPKHVVVARGGGVPREGVLNEVDETVTCVVDGTPLAFPSGPRGPCGARTGGTAGPAGPAAGTSAVGACRAGGARGAGRPGGPAVGLVAGEGAAAHR